MQKSEFTPKLKINRRKLFIRFKDGQSWGPEEIQAVAFDNGVMMVQMHDDWSEDEKTNICFGFPVETIKTFKEYAELS